VLIGDIVIDAKGKTGILSQTRQSGFKIASISLTMINMIYMRKVSQMVLRWNEKHFTSPEKLPPIFRRRPVLVLGLILLTAGLAILSILRSIIGDGGLVIGISGVVLLLLAASLSYSWYLIKFKRGA
jgi:hypothetical protein